MQNATCAQNNLAFFTLLYNTFTYKHLLIDKRNTDSLTFSHFFIASVLGVGSGALSLDLTYDRFRILFYFYLLFSIAFKCSFAFENE